MSLVIVIIFEEKKGGRTNTEFVLKLRVVRMIIKVIAIMVMMMLSARSTRFTAEFTLCGVLFILIALQCGRKTNWETYAFLCATYRLQES